MKISSTLLPAVIIGGAAFLASPRAEAQLVNGSFENGTYTSTLGGNTNPNVPVGWDPNVGFDQELNFNEIRTTPFPSAGLFNLSIGNLDSAPPASLSQTFNDISGNPYTVDFEVYATDGGDPRAFFDASVGPASLSLSDTINSYTLETLTFTGTGSDTLTFTANTNPGEWYVDAVTIQGNFNPVVPNAPDSGKTAILLVLGLAGLGLIHSRYSPLRRKAA
jgi:hypothetical protein